MFHVEHIIWWGVGIIHTPPTRPTFNNHPIPPPPYVYIIQYIPPPPRSTSIPQPPKYIRYFIPPRPLHHHAITFSYTLSTISMTTSYSMVGVRWCATLLRGEFVHISSITMLFFFTCIVFPTLSIVSLSSSINVLSIYSHSLSFWVG